VKASEAVWALDSTKFSLQEVQERLPKQQQGLSAEGGSAAAQHGGGVVPTGASCQFEFEFVELLMVLPKEDGGHYWRGLFEGGEEKSHMQVGPAHQGCRVTAFWPNAAQHKVIDITDGSEHKMCAAVAAS
jgi:hypothetical protein